MSSIIQGDTLILSIPKQDWIHFASLSKRRLAERDEEYLQEQTNTFKTR